MIAIRPGSGITVDRYRRRDAASAVRQNGSAFRTAFTPPPSARLIGERERRACAGRGFAAQGKRYGCGGWHRGFHYAPSSGNRAFDEYRAEALRRLEDEQKEFSEFLERLRKARDQQEFDQFMAERRNRTDRPSDTPEPKPAS